MEVSHIHIWHHFIPENETNFHQAISTNFNSSKAVAWIWSNLKFRRTFRAFSPFPQFTFSAAFEFISFALNRINWRRNWHLLGQRFSIVGGYGSEISHNFILSIWPLSNYSEISNFYQIEPKNTPRAYFNLNNCFTKHPNLSENLIFERKSYILNAETLRL